MADSQRAAGAIKTKMVRDENADRFAGEMNDEFEVDDDFSRQRTFEQCDQLCAKGVDGGLVVVMGGERLDHQDVLNYLVANSARRLVFLFEPGKHAEGRRLSFDGGAEGSSPKIQAEATAPARAS